MTLRVYLNGIFDGQFAIDWCNSLGVVSGSEIGKELHAKARTPDWKDVAFFFLIYGIF